MSVRVSMSTAPFSGLTSLAAKSAGAFRQQNQFFCGSSIPALSQLSEQKGAGKGPGAVRGAGRDTQDLCRLC
jgi:hypothetical protein